jgi:hypothetical protein
VCSIADVTLNLLTMKIVEQDSIAIIPKKIKDEKNNSISNNANSEFDGYILLL